MNIKTLGILALLGAGLAGCAEPTPRFDESFGSAVRTARHMQTINPDAGRNPDPVAGLDGIAAKGAINRYQESFTSKAPPPALNVINIGGAMGGNGSGQ